MKAIFFSIVFALLHAGCSSKKIEITREYITNENWINQWSSPLMIEKMKVKNDSVVNAFSDLSQEEILRKLEKDSFFTWLANANVSVNKEEIYRTKKIYFTKDNGFNWRNEVADRDTNILGSLERNTWYRFSGLVSYPYFVFVYVDSVNNVKRFDVNLANY